MKVGDKYFVQDAYLVEPWMVYAGEILEIGYYKNSDQPVVVFLEFEGFKRAWVPVIGLKEM